MKKASLRFFCPLCKSDRGLRYRPQLRMQNYLHILLIGLVVGLLCWPLMREKSWALIPIVWAIYEGAHKFLYRKYLTCPHCGFDAPWYKRDIKMARKRVEKFWAKG